MNKTIRIVVDGGTVQDVENLPKGWDYEVQDFDLCSECGVVEPLCDECLAMIEEDHRQQLESSATPYIERVREDDK